jgi:signal peptidase II
VALALVAGGALGNLLDRLRSARGVVDFIDIGVGSYRLWTFNIADLGVTAGGVLLAVLLLRRSNEETLLAAPGQRSKDVSI